MKNVILASVLATLSFTAINVSAAPVIDSSTEQKLMKVCKAIQNGSQLQLHKAVKATRVHYRYIVRDLRCNGMSAIAFAEFHGQQPTANYLAHKDSVEQAELLAKTSN